MEQILYDSTRGGVKGISSSEAILRGIAEDGGLFVPQSIPYVGSMLEDLLPLNYMELAYFIMSRFFTDFEEVELKSCIEKAYSGKFDTEEIVPVRKVGDTYLMELFHGPTLAFKDMALSILPHLLKTAAKKLKVNKKIVILTATSGDTGKAALEGFSDVEGTSIIVFFPEDGVSEIQKRQMTSHRGSNTYVIGVKGNFDDAQSGVKKIFTDVEFERLLEKNGYMFSSANSINIGRLIPQIVYYFHAYLKLWDSGEIGENEKINVAVPTGNFGNILAAYYAKKMGLPINKLICASNDNKVLSDFMDTGVYDKIREFHTTISPSMDILVSSNLERLLHIISGKDSKMVVYLMGLLSGGGRYEITSDMKKSLEDFYGGFATEEETRKMIKEVYSSFGYIMDTHTAVAYDVYKKYKKYTGDVSKTVVVSTASPYKFTWAVMTSLDDKYRKSSDFELIREMAKILNSQIPEQINDIERRPVIHKNVCGKDEMKLKVAEILKISNI